MADFRKSARRKEQRGQQFVGAGRAHKAGDSGVGCRFIPVIHRFNESAFGFAGVGTFDSFTADIVQSPSWHPAPGLI